MLGEIRQRYDIRPILIVKRTHTRLTSSAKVRTATNQIRSIASASMAYGSRKRLSPYMPLTRAVNEGVEKMNQAVLQFVYRVL